MVKAWEGANAEAMLRRRWDHLARPLQRTPKAAQGALLSNGGWGGASAQSAEAHPGRVLVALSLAGHLAACVGCQDARQQGMFVVPMANRLTWLGRSSCLIDALPQTAASWRVGGRNAECWDACSATWQVDVAVR